MNWNHWHKHYDVAADFQGRLQVVGDCITAALSECPAGPIRVVSMCAGDGRDLLNALAGHSRRDDITAWLLDTHHASLERGKGLAASAGLEQRVHFLRADAALAHSYRDLIPVDVLILSGMLGHLRNASVPDFLQALPMLCRPGTSLIWSRHLVIHGGQQQAPLIRQVLSRAGFRELGYHQTSATGFAVGRSRFEGAVPAFAPERVLFEFVGLDRLLQRHTAVGLLELGETGWRGRYQDARMGIDVELLIQGDDSGVEPSQIAAIQDLLGGFREEMDSLRRKMFLGWTYRPARVLVDEECNLSVEFQSRLPFLSHKTVAVSLSSIVCNNPTIASQSDPKQYHSLADVERSLPACFEEQVRRYPRRIALASSNWQPTFADLNLAANRLAHHLLAQGGASADRIVLLMEHDAPLIAAFLGVMKAGRIAVVLNPSDPPARLEQVCQDAGPYLIVTDSTHRSLAVEVAGPGRAVVCWEDLPAHLPEGNPEIAITAEDVAYLIYTSGSTGYAKGVMRTHAAALDNVSRMTVGMGLGADDCFTLLGSLSGGQGVTTALCALLNGATLCPFPIMQKGMAGLADWLQARQITVLVASSSVFRYLLKTLGPRQRFPQVRIVQIGSENATAEDYIAWRQHFSDSCLLVNALSSSETGNICLNRLSRRQRVAAGRLSVGRPSARMGVSLWNEQGQEVSGGEVGEMVVKSRFLSPGYWRNPTLTAQRFSGTGADRLFRTGDLARRNPDGSFTMVGRKDARIKVRGYRIEPAEVEDALHRLPNVEKAVVCALTLTSEDQDVQLVAFLTFRAGQPMSAARLRDGLRPILPGHMIPSRFVCLEHFPLTPHGKIDFAQLRQLCTSTASTAAASAPATETEVALANIWKEAFNRDRPGRQDDFFDWGGDSLLAAVVAAASMMRLASSWICKPSLSIPSCKRWPAPSIHCARSAAANPGPPWSACRAASLCRFPLSRSASGSTRKHRKHRLPIPVRECTASAARWMWRS